MVELTKEQIRSCMEEVVDVMRNSVAEVRKDGKPTPKVGALIVKPDGTKETAFRGELREGDHAEYTLIERKCRDQNLTGAILFATLELQEQESYQSFRVRNALLMLVLPKCSMV